jgi:actin-related protein 8
MLLHTEFAWFFAVWMDIQMLCYVAADYEAEVSKDTEASYEVVGEDWFTLSKERFQTGEILFQPLIAGV